MHGLVLLHLLPYYLLKKKRKKYFLCTNLHFFHFIGIGIIMQLAAFNLLCYVYIIQFFGWCNLSNQQTGFSLLSLVSIFRLDWCLRLCFCCFLGFNNRKKMAEPQSMFRDLSDKHHTTSGMFGFGLAEKMSCLLPFFNIQKRKAPTQPESESRKAQYKNGLKV